MKSSRKCNYKGNDTGGKSCDRAAVKGHTTCARHYSAGRTMKVR